MMDDSLSIFSARFARNFEGYRWDTVVMVFLLLFAYTFRTWIGGPVEG